MSRLWGRPRPGSSRLSSGLDAVSRQPSWRFPARRQPRLVAIRGWHNAEVRTIALEEHFWTAELAAPPGTGPLATWGQRVDDQLRDLGRSRLADMDASGIDVQVVSHVAPAAQALTGAEGLFGLRARQLCHRHVYRRGRRSYQEPALSLMPTTPRHLKLSLLPGRFAISRLAPRAAVPEWATQESFSSITRTGEELSIIAEHSLVPAEVQAQSSYRVLKVHGPFVLTEIGVLSALASALAEAGLSLLAISTFDTDYLLVASETISAAITALESRGHKIHRSQEE